MLKQFKKAIISLMAFLLALHFTSATSAKTADDEKTKTSAELYFALEGQHSQPNTDRKKYFECSDKIFAVMELLDISKGKHKFSMRWNAPSGEERERVDYPFTVTQDTTRLWAWLNLIRSRGAGMVQWINPAAGLEEFIGPWTVDVYIDGIKLASESFSVDC